MSSKIYEPIKIQIASTGLSEQPIVNKNILDEPGAVIEALSNIPSD